MLALDGVKFGYPGAATPLFDDLSLKVRRGTAVGVLAPSGSGKSTLLKIAALVLAPAAGRVSIDGVAFSGTRYAVPGELRRKVGLVAQSPRSSTNPRLSLRRIIAEPLSLRDGFRTPKPLKYGDEISALADEVQLSEDLLDRLPHQVSDGQLQRACLARAFALDPLILICDEPTAMLDAPTTAVIMRAIARRIEQGSSALIASHDEPLLNLTCDSLHPLEVSHETLRNLR